jgi:hypothetical protein
MKTFMPRLAAVWAILSLLVASSGGAAESQTIVPRSETVLRAKLNTICRDAFPGFAKTCDKLGLAGISPGGRPGGPRGKRDDQGRDDLPALISLQV